MKDIEVPEEEEFVLPAQSTFGAARWVKWVAVLFPPIAGLCFWIGWVVVEDWLAGKKSVGILVFLLVTLGGVVSLMVAGFIEVLRSRLTLDHEGMLWRRAFTTRRIAWKEIEGYRWTNGQFFVYPARDWWPANLSHFENLGLVMLWVSSHVPDLQQVDVAHEVKEIHADLALGYTLDQKAERLAGLRRLVKTINWAAYVAAVVGAANEFFFGHRMVEAAAACVLILVPVSLVLLALQHRDQVRLDYKEGSLYPEGLTGILASSIALGLMSTLDHHTLLGAERFYQWCAALTALAALLWLTLEWKRIRAQRRWLMITLHVLSVVFLSGFWAGGSIYQVNKHADVSDPVWYETKVIALRKAQDRWTTSYHVKVAPWSSSGEPHELEVSRETYESLREGAAVRISVRAGALDTPWVDEVRNNS